MNATNGKPLSAGAEHDERVSLAPDWRDRFDRARRKIAIVGKAPDSLPLAPWKDESWQIWILNDMVIRNEAPRWDACFEIHNHVFTKEDAHRNFLRTRHGKPIVCNRQRDDVPDCLAYPKDEVISCFGRYMTNSVSAMLAMAVLLNPEAIGVWGANMAADDEYKEQRRSCEYFLGICVGRGISLHMPKCTDLLKCRHIYGLEGDPLEDKITARGAELQQRLADLRARENQVTTERIFVEGMKAEHEYMDSFGVYGP